MLQELQLTNFRFVFTSSIITAIIFVLSLITLILLLYKKSGVQQNIYSYKKQFFVGFLYFSTFIILLQFLKKTAECKNNISRLKQDYNTIVEEISHSKDTSFYMGLYDIQQQLESIKKRYFNFVDFTQFQNDQICQDFQNTRQQFLQSFLSKEHITKLQLFENNQLKDINIEQFVSSTEKQHKQCQIVYNFDKQINIENIITENLEEINKVIDDYLYFNNRIPNVFKVMTRVLQNSEDKVPVIVLSNVFLIFAFMIILYYWNFVKHTKTKKFCLLFGYIFSVLFFIQIILVVVYIILNVSGSAAQTSIKLAKDQPLQKINYTLQDTSLKNFDIIVNYIHNLQNDNYYFIRFSNTKQTKDNFKELQTKLKELHQYYKFVQEKIIKLRSFKEDILNLSYQVFNSNVKDIMVKQIGILKIYLGSEFQTYIKEVFIITVLLGIFVKIQIFFKLYNQLNQ